MGQAGFIKCTLVAVLLLGGVTAPAMAEPSQAVATRGSFAEFRKLAQPLHLIDNIKATFNQQIRKSPDTSKLPAERQAILAAALDRGIENRREVITDLVMAKAAKAFTDDEVVSLGRICGVPAVARFKAGTALAMRSDADETPLRDAFKNDPQLRALPASDLKLLGRLLAETGLSIDAAIVELKPIILAAYTEAGVGS